MLQTYKLLYKDNCSEIGKSEKSIIKDILSTNYGNTGNRNLLKSFNGYIPRLIRFISLNKIWNMSIIKLELTNDIAIIALKQIYDELFYLKYVNLYRGHTYE